MSDEQLDKILALFNLQHGGYVSPTTLRALADVILATHKDDKHV